MWILFHRTVEFLGALNLDVFPRSCNVKNLLQPFPTLQQYFLGYKVSKDIQPLYSVLYMQIYFIEQLILSMCHLNMDSLSPFHMILK